MLFGIDTNHAFNKSVIKYRGFSARGVKVSKLLLASFELPVDQGRDKREFLKGGPDGVVGFIHASPIVIRRF